MRIEEIFIESFGACKRLALREFSPGLNIVVGANEAGKSTAMEFVRSVFFGFKKKTGSTNIYDAPDGIPRSGWVIVGTTSGSRIRVLRRERRGQREGSIVITDEEGNSLGSSVVPLFRSGLDRKLYENLFSFDLDAMRGLDQEALRGKIVAAALGSASVNPLDVIRKVDDRLKATMGTAGRDGDSILALQSRLRELEARLRSLRERPQQYARLRGEIEEVERKRRELGNEVTAKETQLVELTKTLRYEQEWKRLAVLDAELDVLKDVFDFPSDGIVRLERALEQRSEASRIVMELEAGLERLKSRFGAIIPDEEILDRADSIDELATESKRLAGLPKEIDRFQAKVERSRAAVDTDIADLGQGWDKEKLVGADPSPVLEHEIRVFSDLWKQALARISEIRPRLLGCLEQCKRLRASVERKRLHIEQLAPRCEGALSPESQRRLQQWIFYMNRAGDLEGRLSEKAKMLRDLMADREAVDERIRRTKGRTNRIVSPVFFWAIQALLATAAISIAAAAKNADGFTFYSLASIALSLVVVIPAAIRWKLLRERIGRQTLSEELSTLGKRRSLVTREIAETEQGRRTIMASIRELQQNMAEIGRDVLGNPQADISEVLAAGKRSAKAEEPVRRRRILEDSVGLELADLEIEENRGREIKCLLDEATADFETTKAQWNTFLTSRGLDDRWEPEDVPATLVRLRDMRARLRSIEEDEENLAAMKAEWQDFSTRVRDFAQGFGRVGRSETDTLPDGHSAGQGDDWRGSAGREVGMGEDRALLNGLEDNRHDYFDPVESVERWTRRERTAREILAKKMALAERIEDRESSLGVSRKRIQDAANRIDALLEAAGVTDEEAFRARGLRHERYEDLQRERESLLRSLVAGKEKGAADEPFGSMIGHDWDADKELVRTLDSELGVLRIESEEIADRRGRLSKEIESIEAEEEFEKLLAEREELRARLHRSINEWTKLSVASLLLQKTLRVYESEKQPKVLKRGSEIFDVITGGAFRRVLFPLDEDRVKVERHDGTRVDERRLSRGTLEQVFLSLRLAHLDVYHHDDAVPLMMDDILVNFDRDRAFRTANALARFAEDSRRQILFFTCHEHIAALFPHETKRLVLGLRNPETGNVYASL